MTFNAYETSLAQGQPILLFDFSIGIQHFRYTTADRPITYLTNVYAPTAISRSNIVSGNELRQATIQVTAPRDIAVATLYQQAPPSSDVLLTITALHADDPDQQGIVDWVGRVISPSWQSSAVVFSCEPAYTGVLTYGLRRRFQKNCPHVLYGTSCTLNAALFRIAATLSGSSAGGTTLTATAFNTGDTRLTGGYLEWDSGSGYLERRSIDAHAGSSITLNFGHSQLIIGLAVSVYPGCDRTVATCNGRFNNVLNYGGQPFIPGVNPMDGTIIY